MRLSSLLAVLLAAPVLAAPPSAAPKPGPSGGTVLFGSDVHVFIGQRVNGPVVSVGGSVAVDGEVLGPCIALGGEAVVGARGSCAGPVIALGGEARLEGGGRAGGPVISMPAGRLAEPLKKAAGAFLAFSVAAALIFKMGAALGVVLAALLLGGLFPRAIDAGARALRDELKACALAGLVFWPALTAVLLTLAVTIVGLAAWPFLVFLVVCLWVWGNCVLGARLGTALLGHNRRPFGALVLGVLILKGTQWVPILHWVSGLAIAVLGVGAALWTRFGTKDSWGVKP